MMKLSRIREKLQERKFRKPSRRLFEYNKRFRAIRKKEPMKAGDSFRASSLGYVCIREEVLASRYDFLREEHIPPSLQITFDIGDIFHNLYRDLYFGPMGEWQGAWKCLHCGWDTDEAGWSEPPVLGKTPGVLSKMPVKCGGCGAPFVTFDDKEDVYGTFKEWYIADERHFIHGHPDGWNVVLGKPRVLGDLKSQSANSFPSRRSVESPHKVQILSYMHMSEDKHGALWYLNKSPWGDSPSFLRDFEVEYDRDLFMKLVAQPMEKLQDGLAGGSLPERVCASRVCPRAKDCQLADICFG
jgi:hypothetical protein